jgi:methylated-DNA-[protein]-cysteine S-methyltransferase
MDVRTGIVDAPWGPIHLAATRDGVVALESRTVDEAFDAQLRRRGALTIRPLDGGTDDAAGVGRAAVEAVRAYLDGARDALDRLPLDLAGCSAFDREVFAAVRAIPYGSATSYGGVARRVGRPGAARAVGGAVGRCPVGIVIPCHRVVAGDGSLGGYGVGWAGPDAQLDVKRALLALEGVQLPVRALLP